MRWSTGSVAWWIGMTLVALSPTVGRCQFDADLVWIPSDANTLVMVNHDKLIASPLAQKDNWASRGQQIFEAGESIVPPGIDRVTIASQIDFEFMHGLWTVCVFSNQADRVGLQQVSKRVGRRIEKLGDRPALVLPNDTFLVQLDATTIGAMAPANRQSVARWAQTGGSGLQGVSPYLKDAAKFADKNAHVIIAFDLTDVISPEDAVARLQKYESVKADDAEGLAADLAKLRGITLGLTARDKVIGSLKLDFAPGTTHLAKIDKALLLEALERNGVMIDDVSNWEVTVKPNQILLSGNLSSAGMRMLNTLVSQPVLAEFLVPDDSSKESNPQDRTKVYLSAIRDMFAELQEKQQSKNQLKSYALWFERYARKVDDLSAANVDAEVLKLGTDVATQFREISQLLRNAELRRKARATGSAQDSFDSYSDYYGSSTSRYDNSPARRAIRVEEFANAESQAREMIGNLENQIGQIRRSMSAKYGSQF